MIDGLTDLQHTVYRMGRSARDLKHPNRPPSNLSWENKHWWHAGWGDRDIEINGPETPAKVVRYGKS
ncbi:hypothetical protein D3C76_367480 [compost metagenome]